MRKCYVVRGWHPETNFWISGIFYSKRKAEICKKTLEEARKRQGETGYIYSIKTEVLK